MEPIHWGSNLMQIYSTVNVEGFPTVKIVHCLGWCFLMTSGWEGKTNWRSAPQYDFFCLVLVLLKRNKIIRTGNSGRIFWMNGGEANHPQHLSHLATWPVETVTKFYGTCRSKPWNQLRWMNSSKVQKGHGVAPIYFFLCCLVLANGLCPSSETTNK